MLEKTEGATRMDNPETLTTLMGTQDTGWRQTKQNTQHRKLNRWTPPKTVGVNPGARKWWAVPVFI